MLLFCCHGCGFIHRRVSHRKNSMYILFLKLRSVLISRIPLYSFNLVYVHVVYLHFLHAPLCILRRFPSRHNDISITYIHQTALFIRKCSLYTINREGCCIVFFFIIYLTILMRQQLQVCRMQYLPQCAIF